MVTDPKDDFHLYVNKDWILENEIPDGYSSYSQYTARQMNVDEEFRALLTDTSLTSDLALEVQGLYQAILDWDTRNELGFAPLYEELDKVDKINSVEDFYKYATNVEDYSKDKPCKDIEQKLQDEIFASPTHTIKIIVGAGAEREKEYIATACEETFLDYWIYDIDQSYDLYSDPDYTEPVILENGYIPFDTDKVLYMK